jgi:hypothetical protein
MSVTDKWTTREKTTNAFDFILEADGDAINLGAVNHVEMRMVDKLNKTYQYSSSDTSPAVSIVTPASGIVRFTPPNDDVFLYRRSPYKLYWRVWDTATSNYSVPESTFFQIDVLKEY